MLCFEVKGHVITALVNALLGFNSTQASLLQCCLELACFWQAIETFSALLEQLQPLPTAKPGQGVLLRQDLFQMYQALD